MASAMMELLRWNLHPGPGRRNWHGGPGPVTALRGVTAEQAAWRASPGRKSIWELALHIAYWKYAVRRHLSGAALPRFARHPANFPAAPAVPDAAAWARDVALLRSEHDQLVAAVDRLDEGRLFRSLPGGRRWTFGELVLGIAAHDAYHTGQIQLLKRLWQERGGAAGRRRG